MLEEGGSYSRDDSNVLVEAVSCFLGGICALLLCSAY